MNNEHLGQTGIALLRITLGIAAIAHGLLKILVFTMPGAVGFFESVGFPGFLAYVVVAIELVGGFALVAGFQTRIAAMAMIPVLLGAAWVHFGNGWVFSSKGGGWEFPVFWALALAAQALLGSGTYSLDHAQEKSAA